MRGLRVALSDGWTETPLPLKEAELIERMDKNGIGTDASIPMHIRTILDREYCEMRDSEGDLMPHGFWARKRAFLLYKMSPYDRSFWERMRDPWHWIITVFKALPSTQAISFTVQLLLIDKKDDFQLNEFIMQAKGFQFLTSGCFTMIMYSLRLAACRTEVDLAGHADSPASGVAST